MILPTKQERDPAMWLRGINSYLLCSLLLLLKLFIYFLYLKISDNLIQVWETQDAGGITVFQLSGVYFLLALLVNAIIFSWTIVLVLFPLGKGCLEMITKVMTMTIYHIRRSGPGILNILHRSS